MPAATICLQSKSRRMYMESLTQITFRKIQLKLVLAVLCERGNWSTGDWEEGRLNFISYFQFLSKARLVWQVLQFTES